MRDAVNFFVRGPQTLLPSAKSHPLRGVACALRKLSARALCDVESSTHMLRTSPCDLRIAHPTLSALRQDVGRHKTVEMLGPCDRSDSNSQAPCPGRQIEAPVTHRRQPQPSVLDARRGSTRSRSRMLGRPSAGIHHRAAEAPCVSKCLAVGSSPRLHVCAPVRSHGDLSAPSAPQRGRRKTTGSLELLSAARDVRHHYGSAPSAPCPSARRRGG